MNPVITTAPLRSDRKAPYASEEIDRFADRIAAILAKRPGRLCARIEDFCAQIEELLVQSERRRRNL